MQYIIGCIPCQSTLQSILLHKKEAVQSRNAVADRICQQAMQVFTCLPHCIARLCNSIGWVGLPSPARVAVEPHMAQCLIDLYPDIVVCASWPWRGDMVLLPNTLHHDNNTTPQHPCPQQQVLTSSWHGRKPHAIHLACQAL